METITLQCWVYRDDVENIFPIKISRSQTVQVLKEIIKEKKLEFRDVAAKHLRLYSILIPGDDDEHLKDKLRQLSLEDKSPLDSQTRLFPESDTGEEEWLVVVDGPNSGSSVTEPPVAIVPDMTFNYWVRSDTINHVFKAKISRMETVAALKQVIKNENPVGFRDVDANDLALYKVSLPYGEDDSLEAALGARTISSLGKPLWDLQKLSAIFMPMPASADYQLHLIVDGLPLSFQCWIRGAELANSFAVQISIKARVDDLKNAIKAAYGEHRLSPDRLKLYKISELRDRLSLSPLGWGRLLQGNELVERVFDDVPFFQRPRVVVEPGAQRPSLTGSATSNKREHLEGPFEANKRIRHEFVFTMEDQMRCGLPNENHFPLVLAHRIFATFVSECKTYEPSGEDLKFTLNLTHCMRQPFWSETNRRTQFLACMREYDINLTEARIEGTGYSTDGDARVGALPYLICEGRKDYSTSKTDPYIQTAGYHLTATRSWLRAHPDDQRALPCIHIFYNGPVLGFAGSMMTDAFDVNVLGPILPLCYHSTDIDLQMRCAKMFGALKNSATALKEYYEHTMPDSVADTHFPWITQYDTITTPTETREYKYLGPIHGGNLLYICRHIHDKKRILVKFVQTYSKDAHLASAAKDGAPTLLGYHDVLSCGWSVVVMELLEEPDWVSGVSIVDEAEQHMVCDKVREHVLILHQQGFVHGDIRASNVFVKRSDTGHGHTLSIHLVDFDWAGETNKAKYPLLVNPDLGYGFKRPSGVKGGGIITPEHDLAMVDLIFYPD